MSNCIIDTLNDMKVDGDIPYVVGTNAALDEVISRVIIGIEGDLDKDVLAKDVYMYCNSHVGKTGISEYTMGYDQGMQSAIMLFRQFMNGERCIYCCDTKYIDIGYCSKCGE
jgi:hypothetical protein